MNQFMQKIRNKERIKKPFKNLFKNQNLLFIKTGCLIICAILFASIAAIPVKADSVLKLYYYNTKNTLDYKDSQIKVTYNGSKISSDSYPGILVNGYSMVSYKDIFEQSAINADCIYNKEKGTVSISKSGTTIQMTLNSSKAVINGKTVTMPAAPMMVKYVNKGVAKILVPSRFVAENLGYQYTWIKEKNTAAIQKKTVELSYNGGESFEYTGTLASVSIDGSSLNLGSMPSIIQNNTAMLRAKRVFADSKIGAVYKYNSSDRTITLTKNENKLEMKIGSLSGYLNGKSITLPIAPMIVRNLDTGYSFVMVPGNFTANCLGYNYYWNQSKKASEITTKTNQQGGDPELGDDGVINEPGTILYSWKASISSTGNSSGIHEIKNNSSTSADPGFISSVVRDYNTSYVNTEVFKIVSNTPFSNITSSKSDYMIKVKLSKTLSGNQNFQTYGSESMLINSINTTYDPSEVSSEVVFNLLPKTLDYDLSLSSDKMTIYITIYKNTLNEVTIGSNSYGQYISLTGSEPLIVNLTALENSLLIELPYTYNRVGEQYTNLAGDQSLNFVNVLSYLEDRTQILAGFTGKADYQILENGNKYTILFPKKDTSTPGQSNDPSKYEVIIPKPQGITKSMISDEDYYYNHKFSIFLPGDYTSIITSNTITNKSSMVTGISTRLTSDNRTEIMISTSAIQGYQYYTDDNYIYVDIGNPKDIYKNIVVLDPGHGGSANGAHYFSTDEKDLNFKILYEIGKKYFNSDPSKLKVYYTRVGDYDVSLSDRAYFASKIGADMFVSLHMNASTNYSAHGTEVYYSDHNNTPNGAGLTSKTLADTLVKNLTDNLGTLYRGAKPEGYTVVYKNTVPAVLIELGFLSNQGDFSKISDSQFQEEAVKVIYNTILQIFEEYPTGR